MPPLTPACRELQRLDMAEWWAWQARDTAAVLDINAERIAPLLRPDLGGCPVATPWRFVVRRETLLQRIAEGREPSDSPPATAEGGAHARRTAP